MADDRPPTGDSHSDDVAPETKWPKRAPPTLDLSATEIPRTADSGLDEAAPVDEPAAGPAADAAPEAAPRGRKQSTILIPALAGAAAASLVMILISLAGWPVGAPTPDMTAPAPAPATAAAIDDLTARLAKIEARPASTPQPVAVPVTPPLAPRIDALDKTVAVLRDDVAATRTRSEQALAVVSELKAAPPPAASSPDLSAITTRLTQIESAIKTQAAAVAQQAAKPADDAPLRRAVAASVLDLQVRQGQPYAAALQAASVGADPARTKPLQAFAASGLPNAEVLGAELLALLPKLSPAPPPATTGTGLIDRLQAGAARLVTIERSDAIGDSSGAVVKRAAEAARRSDLAATRRELGTLPTADRAVVQPWIDRLDARDAALAASQQLATDAMTALAKPLP